MEVKIQLEHPKPFSSGFRIPFLKQHKPLTFSFQATGLEYLKEIRRLALYFPEPDRASITSLESWAVQQMIQKNSVWFKNTLTPEEIQARFRPSIHPEGHLLVRASPAHLPKHLSLNDRPVENWTTLMESGLDGMVFASVSLVCHGIYLQKKHYELLWKLEGLHIYTMTEGDLLQETNVDEYKEDIETQWAVEIESLEAAQKAAEERLQSEMAKQREKIAQLKTLLSQCRGYGTTHPEWHKNMEHLQGELYRTKKNYFI